VRQAIADVIVEVFFFTDRVFPIVNFLFSKSLCFLVFVLSTGL